MIFVTLTILVLAVIAVIVHKGYFNGSLGPPQFIAKKFLTNNEKDFYKKLLVATAGEYLVAPQVSMGAILDVSLRNKSGAEYWRLRSKFSNKIIDFVLCDISTMDPVLIVELDDVTHDFSKDKHRDLMVAASGLRTLRFWSKNKPDVATLKSAISVEVAKQKFKGR